MLTANKFLQKEGVIEASWRDYTLNYRNKPGKPTVQLRDLLEQYHAAKLQELEKINKGVDAVRTTGDATLLMGVLTA